MTSYKEAGVSLPVTVGFTTFKCYLSMKDSKWTAGWQWPITASNHPMASVTTSGRWLGSGGLWQIPEYQLKTLMLTVNYSVSENNKAFCKH